MRENTRFSFLPIVLVLSIVLIAFCSTGVGFAQSQDKVIVISEKVGEVIDAQEREQFRLFAATKGFKSAVFLELPDSSYVAEITYEEAGEEKKNRLPQSEKSIKFLRDYIDNYEEVKPRFTDLEIKKQEAVRTPFSSGRVTGEILSGIGAGTLVGVGGMCFGLLVLPPGEDDIGGAVLGFLIGYPLGSAIGVYKAGNMGNETGNFAAALGGSILGTAVGIGTFLIDIPQISFLCPPIGAAIGFNATRRYKNPPTETGFINYRDSRLNLAIPSLYYTQKNTFEGKTMTQNVTLVDISF